MAFPVYIHMLFGDFLSCVKMERKGSLSRGNCKVLKLFNFGPRREKTCLGVSAKASFKPVSSATETS